MCNHTLHRTRKQICRYCLQAFSTDEILKRYINSCFTINDKRKIITPKNMNMLNLKIMREK